MGAVMGGGLKVILRGQNTLAELTSLCSIWSRSAFASVHCQPLIQFLSLALPLPEAWEWFGLWCYIIPLWHGVDPGFQGVCAMN